MANILELNAQTRELSGSSSVRRMRKGGNVPAVVYGSKTTNANLQVSTKTVTQLLKESASENVLVNLQIDGTKTQLALIQKVQHDYLKGGILHIDFHAVDINEPIHATVPVEVVGDAEGVKAGGQLDLMLHVLEVHCLPKDLPEKISIDVTHVGQSQGVHVKDLKLPAGVSVHLDGEVLILSITEPRVVETPAQAAAAAPKAAAKK